MAATHAPPLLFGNADGSASGETGIGTKQPIRMGSSTVRSSHNPTFADIAFRVSEGGGLGRKPTATSQCPIEQNGRSAADP